MLANKARALESTLIDYNTVIAKKTTSIALQREEGRQAQLRAQKAPSAEQESVSNKVNFEIGLADSKPVHGEIGGGVDTEGVTNGEGDASSKDEGEPEV